MCWRGSATTPCHSYLILPRRTDRDGGLSAAHFQVNAQGVQAAFCFFRHFAHRAFCAAMIRLRAAGDSGRLGSLAVEAFVPFTFAQRAH